MLSQNKDEKRHAEYLNFYKELLTQNAPYRSLNTTNLVGVGGSFRTLISTIDYTTTYRDDISYLVNYKTIDSPTKKYDIWFPYNCIMVASRTFSYNLKEVCEDESYLLFEKLIDLGKFTREISVSFSNIFINDSKSKVFDSTKEIFPLYASDCEKMRIFIEEFRRKIK